MPRLHDRPPSGYRFRLPGASRKKSGKRLVLRRVRKPQSLLGTMSITLALIGLFLLGVDALLKAQTSQAATEAFESFKNYLMPVEFFTGLAGLMCGVFSFGLSSKKQRNAVLGVILNVGFLIGWFVARNYLK